MAENAKDMSKAAGPVAAGAEVSADTCCVVGKFRAKGSASKLVGHQRLLCIFVSDTGADPWINELRKTVEVHIESSRRWLEEQAQNHGSSCPIECKYLPEAQPAIGFNGTINEADYRAGPHHSTWQNQVATNLAGHSVSLSGFWDELFGQHLPCATDNGTAVLFFVRRYVPSVAFQYDESQDPEFAKERGVIYDNGGPKEGQRHLDSQIAHEILHLYGAIDLKVDKVPVLEACTIDRIVQNVKPTEVMVDPTQRPIGDYHVGDLTAYLVGWTDVLPGWLSPNHLGI